tara:strand:- start:132 stop:365 length:234 start_codon:yes stop_codon:yes gene_type:complete
MVSLYKKSEVVRVFEYYDDMIVKNSYVGIIIECRAGPIINSSDRNRQHYIYDVLSLEDNAVRTAEEFAVRPINKEAV